MANYGGFGRTNYFRVKDVEAFETAAEPFGAVHRRDDGLVTVLATNESGDFSAYDDETDEERDLADVLPDHLADGEVAVLMSVGAEKLRYIEGWAVAVHSSGERVELSLNDIYAEAQETFPDASITQAVS